MNQSGEYFREDCLREEQHTSTKAKTAFSGLDVGK